MVIVAGGLHRVVRGSNQHLSDLLQVVLLEVAVSAEEYPLGSADLVRLVLDRGQLYLVVALL